MSAPDVLTHRRVLAIALPIVLANATIPILGMVDTGVVGRLGEAAPIGAVGIGAVILTSLYWVFGFLRMGTSGLVAQSHGAGDAGESGAHLVRALGIGLVAGLVLIAAQAPLVAGAFAFLLLAMAGIPLTSGFTGKWAVFAAALLVGAWPVVIVAVLMSAVAAYFYVRVIVLMFFSEPTEQGEAPASVVRPGWTTLAVVGVGAVATIAFGVLPGPLLALAQQASEFIR